MRQNDTGELELLKMEAKNALNEATERLRISQKQTIIWIVGTVGLCAVAIIIASKLI